MEINAKNTQYLKILKQRTTQNLKAFFNENYEILSNNENQFVETDEKCEFEKSLNIIVLIENNILRDCKTKNLRKKAKEQYLSSKRSTKELAQIMQSFIECWININTGYIIILSKCYFDKLGNIKFISCKKNPRKYYLCGLKYLNQMNLFEKNLIKKNLLKKVSDEEYTSLINSLDFGKPDFKLIVENILPNKKPEYIKDSILCRNQISNIEYQRNINLEILSFLKKFMNNVINLETDNKPEEEKLDSFNVEENSFETNQNTVLGKRSIDSISNSINNDIKKTKQNDLETSFLLPNENKSLIEIISDISRIYSGEKFVSANEFDLLAIEYTKHKFDNLFNKI